jgi:gluconolactonase
MIFPNGLAFSPDERVIYIDDFRRGHIRPTGYLRTSPVPSPAPLMAGRSTRSETCIAVARAESIFLTHRWKKLGRIVHGQPATTNIGFGGDDLKTLFFTSRTHLGSVNIKIAGIPAPPPKRT